MEENGTHKWNIVEPLADEHSKPLVKCPQLIPLDDTVKLQRPNHFELFYVMNTHLDAIVSSTTGKVCNDNPVLTKNTSV